MSNIRIKFHKTRGLISTTYEVIQRIRIRFRDLKLDYYEHYEVKPTDTVLEIKTQVARERGSCSL